MKIHERNILILCLILAESFIFKGTPLTAQGSNPIVLSDRFPISMCYHGATPGENTMTEEIAKYAPVEIWGSVRRSAWEEARAKYPDKIILKQSAWGSDIETKDKASIWPGHFLLRTGAKLAGDAKATDTILFVDDYLKIARNQNEINQINSAGKPLYLLIYRLDEDNKPDWNTTERVIVTGITTDRGFIVKRGELGSIPLTMERGKYVLARHMLFWSGQWQLNFSLQCPRGGPDNLTATEWFARQIADYIEESGADGIEFDVARSGNSVRWGPSDCNNDLVTDYGMIDGVQSFGLGSELFLRELRRLTGPDKIIQYDGNSAIGNARGRKYVNGVQLESFPNANDFNTFSEAFLHFRLWTKEASYLPKFSYAYVKTTTTTFAGMVDTDGSNLDWRFRVGFASNLMMGMPCPFTSISDPDFIPDEDTNISIGETTTEFFKWDENVGGELDDWKWLGRSLNAAMQVLDDVDSTNLLEQTEWIWRTETDLGFVTNSQINNGEYSTDITALPSNIPPGIAAKDYYPGTKVPRNLVFGNRLEILSGDPTFIPGQEYTLEFEARGNDHWEYWGETFEEVPRAMSIITQYLPKPLSVLISNDWKPYRLSFYATENKPLIFGFSEQIGDAAIRNIRLYEGGSERWIREFEDGIVLLNMTRKPWDCTLPPSDKPYQRLKGTQNPDINDGSIVEGGSIIVPSFDAVFLLKQKVETYVSPNTSENLKIKVFPVPVEDHFIIKFHSDSKDTDAHISLSDLTGKRVLEKKMRIITGANSLQIDINGFKNGIYIGSVQIGATQYFFRIYKL